VRVDVIVFARRSRRRWRQVLWDPVHLAVRRQFIKRFLTADAIRLNGVRYHPASLIEADRDMAEYFAWVATTAHGRPYVPSRTGRLIATEIQLPHLEEKPV
jgi:hypothetical protein